jgi:hypothetical protein
MCIYTHIYTYIFSVLSFFPPFFFLLFSTPLWQTWIKQIEEPDRIPACTCIVTLQCALLSIVPGIPLVLRASWSWSNLFVYCALDVRITCVYVAGRHSARYTVSDIHIFVSRELNVFRNSFLEPSCSLTFSIRPRADLDHDSSLEYFEFVWLITYH